MHFEFPAQAEAFREELREFLRAELPPWWRGRFNEEEKSFDVIKRIGPKMGDRGWLTMHWPKAYGGRDASMWEQVVMREEVAVRNEPRGSNYMAGNWVGPSIIQFGTEEQKREHLTKIAAGQRWCQGFSEPGAGSDLAALRTRAVREGDQYVINGQKIWTSHTPTADMMFLVTRTDPSARKHRGLTVILLPLKTPGVRVRPIESMMGTVGEFAEVFFDDVRVPVGWRLGPENDGWRVALTALAYERLGVPRWRVARYRLDVMRRHAKHAIVDGRALYDDPVIRQRFAELSTEIETARLLYMRTVSEDVRGNDITLIVALSRVHGTNVVQKVGAFAMELLGGLGEIEEDGPDWVPMRGMAGEWWMLGIVATIAAGTTEVNKNNIATRGLGLPRA
ncbi:MAG: acyl-CoA dehydrogenase family protein [Gammaproteobacteria bacterium]